MSGSGVFVKDDDGREYLDGVAGIGVMSLGYGREDLVEAAAAQARKISFTHSMRFRNEPQERLAQQLAEITPPGLDWAFFCSGGSEALDSTVKLVRQYWLDRGQPSRWKVIGRRPSFHGNTLNALSVGYHAGRRAAFEPYLLDLPHLPAPWIYRCEQHGMDGPWCDDCSGRALADVIEAAGPETVAAFIAEPIVGAAAPGVTPPPGYYETIREICDRYEVLFIADEVITGIGRTGVDFGIQHWDVAPDVMMVAKGLSGGYASLAGVIAHERVIDVLRAGGGRYEHNFTFAGNPIACAVGAPCSTRTRRRPSPTTSPRSSPCSSRGSTSSAATRSLATSAERGCRPASSSSSPAAAILSPRRSAPFGGSTWPPRRRASSSTRAPGSSTARREMRRCCFRR